MIAKTDSNNEQIEVCDASIIKDNEHPRFKIGDVINNGYGDFIVKGFTRSFMGLAYVLDNGSKIIGWLTEQVDAKCHLVERNNADALIEKAVVWLKLFLNNSVCIKDVGERAKRVIVDDFRKALKIEI